MNVHTNDSGGTGKNIHSVQDNKMIMSKLTTTNHNKPSCILNDKDQRSPRMTALWILHTTNGEVYFCAVRPLPTAPHWKVSVCLCLCKWSIWAATLYMYKRLVMMQQKTMYIDKTVIQLEWKVSDSRSDDTFPVPWIITQWFFWHECNAREESAKSSGLIS